VNLAQLADETATLKGRFAGEVTGVLNLVARGIGREALIGSLEGGGVFTVRGARLRGLDLATVSLGGRPLSSSPPFQTDAGFSVGKGQVRFERLDLRENGNHFEASGSADFSRALDLNVRRVSSRGRATPPPPRGQSFRLTGTLEAPAINLPTPSAGPPAKPGRKSAAKKP